MKVLVKRYCRFILFILLLVYANDCYSAGLVSAGRDSIIVKSWVEGGVSFKIEIKIRNATDSNGVNPGAATESYIEIKKSSRKNGVEKVLFEHKDSCDPQIRQLIFYDKCMQFKDLNKDGKKDLVLLYEFGGDDYDSRTAYWVLVHEKGISVNKIVLEYSEQSMRYFKQTKVNDFIKTVPPKFRAISKLEFNKWLNCLLP